MLAKRTNFRKTVHIYLIQSVHFDIVIYIIIQILIFRFYFVGYIGFVKLILRRGEK